MRARKIGGKGRAQIERKMDAQHGVRYPWGEVRRREGSFLKKWLHRQERKRARLDPECQPLYRAWTGYVW